MRPAVHCSILVAELVSDQLTIFLTADVDNISDNITGLMTGSQQSRSETRIQDAWLYRRVDVSVWHGDATLVRMSESRLSGRVG